MSKVPLKVKIGLALLKRNCEKNTFCESCIFYNKRYENKGSSCDLVYQKPYANYRKFIEEWEWNKKNYE